MTHTPYDLIIIGGGPAGLPATLMAGRARMKTALINAEAPRNFGLIRQFAILREA